MSSLVLGFAETYLWSGLPQRNESWQILCRRRQRLLHNFRDKTELAVLIVVDNDTVVHATTATAC